MSDYFENPAIAVTIESSCSTYMDMKRQEALTAIKKGSIGLAHLFMVSFKKSKE